MGDYKKMEYSFTYKQTQGKSSINEDGTPVTKELERSPVDQKLRKSMHAYKFPLATSETTNVVKLQIRHFCSFPSPF